MPNRVAFIVDNNETEQYFLRVFFAESVPDMVNAGCYLTVEEALGLMRGTSPQVVVLDIHDYGREHRVQMKQILELLPDVKLIIRSKECYGELIQELLSRGACGFVWMKSSIDELLKVIRRTLGGPGWGLCHDSMNICIESLIDLQPERDLCAEFGLTRREAEIFHCLEKDEKYKTIAYKLYISVETVRAHVKSLYEKLDVNSRLEAIYKVYPYKRPF